MTAPAPGTRPADTRPALCPFLGREGELAELEALFDKARWGLTLAALISGPAGFGKSRLVEEFAQAIPRDSAFHIRLQCAPQHRESPLWPFQRQLMRVARIGPGDNPALRTEKLRQYLSVPGSADPEAALPSLSDLIDDGPVTGLAGPLRRRRVMAAIVDALAGRVQLRPLLMTVEDTHWIDGSSLEMIAHLLDHAGAHGWRLLVLLSSRPEGRAALSRLALAHEIALAPLQADIASRLAAGAVRGAALGPQEIATIAARGAGNPLMLEELARATALDAEHRVPASLAESLGAQLAEHPTALPLLGAAACCGTDFDADLLARVVDEPLAEVLLTLRPLEEMRLVFRRGPVSETLFGFRHSLICEAAREALSADQRRALHARILAVLLEDGSGALPEIVAGHAVEAGRITLAIDRLEEAGQRSAARGAVAEAVRHLEQAIALLPRSGLTADEGAARELRLQLALGATLISTRGYAAEATRTAFQRAEHLGRSLGNPAQHIATLYGIYGYSLVGARIDAAHRIAGEILAAAEAEGSARARIVGHRTLGLTSSYLGAFVEANRHLAQVLELYDLVDRDLVVELSNDPKVTALCFLSVNRLAMGHPTDARRRADAAVAHARLIGHLPSLCYALDFQCTALALTRSGGSIRETADLLMRRAGEQGLDYWVGLGCIWLGWDRAVSGADRGGLRTMRDGLAALEATGGTLVTPFFLGLLAEASAALGETAGARAVIEEAILRATQTSERWYLAELYRLDAAVGARSGDPERAERRLAEALALAEAQGAALWGLRAARDLALRHLDADRPAAARALLSAALGQVRERSDMPDIAEAAALLRTL